MEDLQFIVSRLNEIPFKMNLTLVDFDEKSPIEVLDILNTIFSKLEPEMNANIRDEEKNVTGARMAQFLIMLKCTLIPQVQNGDESDRHRWILELTSGNKKVVLPIIGWVLSSFDVLKKRAYLARFLIPIGLPDEIKREDNKDIEMLVEEYAKLQDQFKTIHRKYDESLSPEKENKFGSDIKMEILQLKREKSELKEKISVLKTKTKKYPDIEKVLSAAKRLRLEQEKEMHLIGRKNDQKNLLHLVDLKLSNLRERLYGFEQNFSQESCADNILAAIKKEVEETKKTVRIDMVTEISRMKDVLSSLMKQRLEPTKTEKDLEKIRSEVISLEDEYQKISESVQEKRRNSGLDKLLIFRQHVGSSASKVIHKEAELDAKRKTMETLQKEVNKIENKANEMLRSACSNLHSNGVVLSINDMKKIGVSLREKTAEYDTAKEVLRELQTESVTLIMTEQILKKRVDNIEEFLKQQEQTAGLEGFRDVQMKLENDSEKTSNIDDKKSQTLEEITSIISTIAMKLEGMKKKLKPMIKDLKGKRDEFRNVQKNYQEKKSRFDRVVLKTTTEQHDLEKKCEELQNEWFSEERKFYHLNAMNDATIFKLERVQMETEWKIGKHSSKFISIEDIYSNKIQQQANLAKELRKKQRSIRENMDSHTKQRHLFLEVGNLLSCKLELNRRNEETLNEDEEFIDKTVDVCNAQVLCID